MDDTGCIYTPSLRIQTAPELEDAGNLVYIYIDYMRFQRGFIVCDDKDDGRSFFQAAPFEWDLDLDQRYHCWSNSCRTSKIEERTGRFVGCFSVSYGLFRGFTFNSIVL